MINHFENNFFHKFSLKLRTDFDIENGALVDVSPDEALHEVSHLHVLLNHLHEVGRDGLVPTHVVVVHLQEQSHLHQGIAHPHVRRGVPGLLELKQHAVAEIEKKTFEIERCKCFHMFRSFLLVQLVNTRF